MLLHAKPDPYVQERERAVEAASSEAQHAELVERINQLTILRESNATLRTDCEAHAKRARELDAKLKQLSSELDPTREQLHLAQAELEAKNQHIRSLEDESRRWKERNAQLLSKVCSVVCRCAVGLDTVHSMTASILLRYSLSRTRSSA